MDRWLSLIPAVLLALSLAACGQVEPDAPAPGGAVPPAAADSPLAEGEDAAETPRAVMTGGALYYDTGRESSVTGRCGNLDGEITSRCAADALPERTGNATSPGPTAGSAARRRARWKSTWTTGPGRSFPSRRRDIRGAVPFP